MNFIPRITVRKNTEGVKFIPRMTVKKHIEAVKFIPRIGVNKQKVGAVTKIESDDREK